MKLPFLSAKAEQTINKVVDIAGEKLQKTMSNATEDKLQTAAILLPIAATAFLIYSGTRSSNKPDIPIPYKVVINNYYYCTGKGQ